MKIKEHDSMMAYLTRKPNILSNNINNKKILHTERQRLAKGTKSDTKGMSNNAKMLQYINDMNIVYGDKKASKAETEAATKRVESRSEEAKKMSYQDEYNFLYNNTLRLI